MRTTKKKSLRNAVIIGAGPAGLTAGFELSNKHNFSVTILEKDAVVGGLSKTTEYKGCHFDIGPHHFITDSLAIEQWWKNVMHGDFIPLRRFTRIYYKQRFFHYPLQPINVLKNLNFWECISSIVSYIKIRLFPTRPVLSFEDWVTNRFGARLFKMFFKTYTEKLWGISCNKISADWAAERIKTFSLAKAIFYAFFGRWFKKNTPRTIRDLFYYPSGGAGTLWQNVAAQVLSNKKNSIQVREHVVEIEHVGNNLIAISTRRGDEQTDGGGAYKLTRYMGDYFFSTMPLRDLVLALNPAPPQEIITAARSLKYRALITVNLIVNKANICPDHWLYIHEPTVMHIRMGNMNNFSLKMVDHSDHTALSLEYFTWDDDHFWFTPDAKLVQLAKQELETVGIAKAADVIDGMVLRTAQAYPVYDEHYKEHLSIVLTYLKKFSNLQVIGRNGTHSYNNMDIAMISAMNAVDLVVKKEQKNTPTVQMTL